MKTCESRSGLRRTMYAMQDSPACGRLGRRRGTCIMHQTRSIGTTAEFISTYQECHEVMTGARFYTCPDATAMLSWLLSAQRVCPVPKHHDVINLSPMPGRPVDLSQKEKWVVSRHGRRFTYPLPSSNRTRSPLSFIPKLLPQHWWMWPAKVVVVFC